jgi:GNAT superfamily N-acetyltransferase
MTITIEKASLEDVDELLKLYFEIYGPDYPVRYGTDRPTMIETIKSESYVWVVARDERSKKIAGSVVFELDRADRVGKVSAAVVRSQYRGQKLATRMIRPMVEEILTSGLVDSMYTTVRTLEVAPQLIFTHADFLPLGIFPNAHKISDFETFTLFAKFRPGILEARPALRTHGKLAPIYAVLNDELIEHNLPLASVTFDPPPPFETEERSDIQFECIIAPEFVKKLFLETYTDPYDRFYPFHSPNTLIVSHDGETKIWCHLSKKDGYCAIVNFGKAIYEQRGIFRSLMRLLREQGISYIEVLIGAEHIKSIEVLIQSQFLPSAIYPAMLKNEKGIPTDFVVMSRTVEPLNFRGIRVASSFKPYMDQYVELWKQMHLDTLEVFNDYE